MVWSTVAVLGLDVGYTVKHSPLPQGTPKGKGLYLTVYPELSLYIDSILFLIIIMVMIP